MTFLDGLLLSGLQLALLLVAVRASTTAYNGLLYTMRVPVLSMLLLFGTGAGIIAIAVRLADAFDLGFYLWAWSAFVAYLVLARVVGPFWHRVRHGLRHWPIDQLYELLTALVVVHQFKIVHVFFGPEHIGVSCQRWPIVGTPRRFNFLYEGCPYCTILPILHAFEEFSPGFRGLTASFLRVVELGRLPYLILNPGRPDTSWWYQCMETPLDVTLDRACAEHSGRAA